ncbi:hypothetical protein [Escherichia coli]|nr:hypothetical protein [Escherichia coli]
MDKKQIEALQSIIEKQDEAIRILSYRTDMILNTERSPHNFPKT